MGEPSTPSILWFLDFWTCPWAPKPIIFIFGHPKIPQILQEKAKISSGNNIFYKSQNVGNRKLWKLWKRRGPTNHEDPSWKLLKSWIRDQYLPEYMKWNFGSMGSLNLWNCETLKLWNQETVKPRNQETQKLWNRETKKPKKMFK